MPTIPNRCHIFRPAEKRRSTLRGWADCGATCANWPSRIGETSGDISNEKEKLLIQRRGFIVSIHNFQTKHPQEQNASCCPTNMSAPIYLCIDVSMYRCSYVPVYLFIYLPTYLSTYLSIHPSIHFSISISISTS